jgi:hypothetical protein
MVGPSRSWLLAKDGWPAVPFLHCARDTIIKDNVVCGIPKGQMFEKKCRARPKRNSEIRDRGLRQQLCLGSKRAFNKTVSRLSDWRSWSKYSGFLSGYGKWVTGHRGGVGPLQNETWDVKSGTIDLGWWCYTGTSSHLIREPLGTSGLKEGTAGVVGE